ncbi:unnamed protein product [Rhizophagus irregularis]|nr:unnamed protein product [Rhizophagus irregularis]
MSIGGFSDIYTANWIDGYYIEWDTKKQQLIRFGTQYVVLKELVNVEGASQIWFEEAKSHLNISSKYPRIASKVHQFEKFPEPRNATEEEQEAFYSKSYDLNIPDNFYDSNSNYASTSKTSSKLKGFSKRLSKVFKPLNINSKNDK